MSRTRDRQSGRYRQFVGTGGSVSVLALMQWDDSTAMQWDDSTNMEWDQPTDTMIGGLAIGSVGAPGTPQEGLVLNWGDDFETLNLVGPTPNGYLTTKGAVDMPGARGGATTAHNYTDPYYTGNNDSNRGVPLGSDTLSIQNGSWLRLGCRKATTLEKANFAPTSYGTGVREIAASSINTIKQCMYYVGANAPIVISSRVRHTPKATNPAGWHPTVPWTLSGAPATGPERDEIDFNEANSQSAYFNRNIWTGGAPTTTDELGPIDTLDGLPHIYTAKFTRTSVALYVDGVLVFTMAKDGNSKNLPAYIIFTSVVFLNSYHGETFNLAAWTASALGAAAEVDYIQIFSPVHYKPLVSLPDVNVAYQGSTTIPIPSKIDLWGDSGVTEYFQNVAAEVNDPTSDLAFTKFIPGVSQPVRDIVINWVGNTARPGRLHFHGQAYKTTSGSCEPLNFVVNRGPNITAADMNFTNGVAVDVDLYTLLDCGNLVPKVATVTGLSTGLSFSPTTFRITGTPTVNGTSAVTIGVTNSVGQTVSKNINVTIANVATTLNRDGYVQNNSTTTSCVVTLSTTKTMDLIVLCISNAVSGAGVVTSVTDAAGLTWTKLTGQTFGASNFNQEIWTAPAPNILTSNAITVTVASPTTTNLVVRAIAYNNGAGAYPTIDGNASLPALATSNTGATPSKIISTNGSNVALLAHIVSGNGSGLSLGPTVTRPSGYSVVGTGSFTDLSERIVTTAQSGVTQSWSWTNGSGYGFILLGVKA